MSETNEVTVADDRRTLAIQAVNAEIQPVLKLPVTEIVDEVVKYADFGNQAIVQANKAVIDSVEALGKGGDLLKAINGQIKALGETRMSNTDKLDKLKKYLMGLFGAGLNKLEEAKLTLNTKMNAFIKAENERKRKEAEDNRKKIEDEAIARAQVQASLGDGKGADQIMQEGAKAADKAALDNRVVSRGSFGSVTSTRKRWVATVENPSTFIEWLAAHQPSRIADCIDFRKVGLNAVAKEFGEAQKTVPGLKIEQDEKAQSK